MLPNKNRQELEDRLIRISKILNDTYKNKSSEEYKMKGDITKSTYYPNIEKMIADLTTLRGYPKTDASDLNQVFNTLHRPFFKNMVKEYMAEPNERNTVFCALFTLGYRLLIGELSRIYTSTEATSKGIEYKPDKVSRRNDISKIIAIYKGDLEAKINAEIRATSKAKNTIEESYLEDVISMMYIEEYLDEAFGDDIYDESVKTMKRETRDALRSDVVRNAIGELVRSKDIKHVNLDDYDDYDEDENGVKPVKEAISPAEASKIAKAALTGQGDSKWFDKLTDKSPNQRRLSDILGDDDDDADGVKPVEEARFGRFREIRGDSPDMELPSLKNTRPPDDESDYVMSKLPQIKGQRPLFDDSERPREIDGMEEPRLKRVGEEADDASTTVDEPSISTAENNLDSSNENVQEGVVDAMEKMAGRISDAADKIGPKVANISAWAAPIAAGLGILASLFGRIAGFMSGKNPIAEINFYFTNKYEKTISKFNTVASNYFATKEAYDEYMKIPAAQRNKKVESRYIKNMDKYNMRMKNLEAQIEHFNSRAKDDASAPVPKPPKSEPTPKSPDTTGNGGGNPPKNDDDDFNF